MSLNAYLFFNGQCKEAFTFYAQVLGGTIVAMMPHSDMPGDLHVSADQAHTIMHARMTIGADVLMGSDAMGDLYERPQGFSLSVVVDEPAEADRIYSALAEGGNQTMPIQETFWAVRFGALVDRFGTPWMVNCEKTPEA